MITIFDRRTRSAARLSDELTASHSALRREAATCLHAMAATIDGDQGDDICPALDRFRDFLRLTCDYCDGRRTLLWPLLARLFPYADADLILLSRHSLALKSDLSVLGSALDELFSLERLSRDDRTIVSRALLDTIRPAKIMHDSLSLYLGDEELVIRDLIGGLSPREIVRARRVLIF